MLLTYSLTRVREASLVASLAALVLAPVALQAQRAPVRPDQLGVTLSSSAVAGGTFNAGASGEASAEMRAVAASLSVQLSRGALIGADGATLPAEAQRTVLAVLAGAKAGSSANARLVTVLMGAGADALPAATRLVEAVEGLITAPGAARLERAVRAYNGLVGRASAAFLVEQPGEFLALREVLAGMLRAVEGGDGR